MGTGTVLVMFLLIHTVLHEVHYSSIQESVLTFGTHTIVSEPCVTHCYSPALLGSWWSLSIVKARFLLADVTKHISPRVTCDTCQSLIVSYYLLNLHSVPRGEIIF
jgi:hypothetical protein